MFPSFVISDHLKIESFVLYLSTRKDLLSLSRARLTSCGIPYEFHGGVSEIVTRILNKEQRNRLSRRLKRFKEPKEMIITSFDRVVRYEQ
ncbi:hypothetical protein LXL04_015216 [Taraxacum kok-saghyz]